MKYLSNLNFLGNYLDMNNGELRNVRIHNLATDPTTGLVEGRIYYNTAEKEFKIYNGTSWEVVGKEYLAGTGLTLDGLTINHSNSVTAGTASGSSGTLAHGDSFTIPSITYDAQGHITGKSTTSLTLPAAYVHPTHPGDDIDVDTGALTGAVVISDIDFNVTTDTLGHVTDANAAIGTRTLTLADLGYTGDTDANNYVHPTPTRTNTTDTASPAHGESFTVIDSVTSNLEGHVTGANTTTITLPAQYVHPSYDGDDIDVDTGLLSGAYVISDLDFNVTTDSSGHVTDANATVATRQLTLADLGHTESTDFKTITVTGNDEDYSWSATGSAVADTLGDTLTLVDGGGIDIHVDASSDAVRIQHADTSTLGDLTASSRTYVTGLTFDTYGHVTALTTGTETVVNTDRYVNNASFNTGTGVLTLTRAGSDTVAVTVDLDGRYLQSYTETQTLDDVTTLGNTTTNSIQVGALTTTGNVTVGGNLVVSGTTTSVNTATLEVADYIIEIAKDNTAALASYAGFVIPNYDGTNDGALIIDANGEMRIGDVTYSGNTITDVSTQPVLTRDETTNLSDGDLLVWDATNNKAVGKTALESSVVKKYAATIGDGSATSYQVTHNLGTTDVVVSVKDTSTNEIVYTDVVVSTSTYVTVSFASAPSAGAYRVVVTG